MSLLASYRPWILYQGNIANDQPLTRLEHLLTLRLVEPRKLLCATATAESHHRRCQGLAMPLPRGALCVSEGISLSRNGAVRLRRHLDSPRASSPPTPPETLLNLRGEAKPEPRGFIPAMDDPPPPDRFPGAFRRLQPCPEHPRHRRGSRAGRSTPCPPSPLRSSTDTGRETAGLVLQKAAGSAVAEP